MKSGYTYIMGSPTGTLYVGVTSDIHTRVQQHKNGTFEGFSKQYNCTRLLYYEQHEDIKQIHSPGKTTKRLAPRKEAKPGPYPKPRLQRPRRNLGLEAHHRPRKNEPLKTPSPTHPPLTSFQPRPKAPSS